MGIPSLALSVRWCKGSHSFVTTTSPLPIRENRGPHLPTHAQSHAYVPILASGAFDFSRARESGCLLLTELARGDRNGPRRLKVKSVFIIESAAVCGVLNVFEREFTVAKLMIWITAANMDGWCFHWWAIIEFCISTIIIIGARLSIVWTNLMVNVNHND